MTASSKRQVSADELCLAVAGIAEFCAPDLEAVVLVLEDPASPVVALDGLAQVRQPKLCLCQVERAGGQSMTLMSLIYKSDFCVCLPQVAVAGAPQKPRKAFANWDFLQFTRETSAIYQSAWHAGGQEFESPWLHC